MRSDGLICFHWRKIEELWNRRRDPRVQREITYHYHEIQALTPDPQAREELQKSIKHIQRPEAVSDPIQMPSNVASASERTLTHKEPGGPIKDVILCEKPNVSWEEVAGLGAAKRAIRESVILPLVRPDLFDSIGLSPWRGILLVGPPGCGKTLLARAAASECDATFFNISMADILNKFVGESEKFIQALFREARKKQPSIVYMDEVDAISSHRGGDVQEWMRSVVSQLLTEMDGLLSRKDERLVLLGSTNVPWDIDPAMRRRFERRIFVPIPDYEGRREMFRIHTRRFKLASDIDFDRLAEMTDGYTGSDIELVCREAGLRPIRELDEKGLLTGERIEVRPISNADFVEAIRSIKSSVSPEEAVSYEEWAKKYATE